MESLQNEIQTVADLLQQVAGLPAAVLTVLVCVIAGYLFKLWPSFPNQAIPAIVVILGGGFYPFIADSKTQMFTEQPRVWIMRAVAIGLIYGFGAWLLHNKILSKIEDKLGLFTAPKTDAGTLGGTVTKP